MRTRRTQQTSILDYVGSQAPRGSTSTQTHREAPISFTAVRVPTQSHLVEGEEAGDEVDSEDEGRLDRFRLDHRKTRLDTEEPAEPRFGRGARSQPSAKQIDKKQITKKKVLSGYDDEDSSTDDGPSGPRKRKDSVDIPLKSSSQAREAIDAIVIHESSSSSASPPKSTASPRLRTRRQRSGIVLSGSSAQVSSQNQDDPLRTPTQDRPRRDPQSSRKRRRRVLEDEDEGDDELLASGRGEPGPSTRSASKRKTRSDGPVTPPSPLDSGEPLRTRKKTKQVDYYESDDPIDLLTGKGSASKGKGRITENLDDAVFEAETSLSPSQSMSRKPGESSVNKYGRRTRGTGQRNAPIEEGKVRQAAARPQTTLKIFSSESEAEPEAEPDSVRRGWSSTPPVDSDDGGKPGDIITKSRAGKRKKGRTQDPDEIEEDIDPKELLEEIALDKPGKLMMSTLSNSTEKADDFRAVLCSGPEEQDEG